MQNFLSFIKSKQFLIQMGLVVAVIVITLFVTNKWLTAYTGHGQYVPVPDFKGQKIGDLDNFIKEKNVLYKIIDSLYDPKQPTGIVLRQDPEAETNVKHNRTVYLYVTGMVPPQVLMPKLVDRSERQARLILETYGLKVGHISEKPADCNGCVLAQLVKGKPVEPGKGVKKGSAVDLVIGIKDQFYQEKGNDSAATKKEEPNFDNE